MVGACTHVLTVTEDEHGFAGIAFLQARLARETGKGDRDALTLMLDSDRSPSGSTELIRRLAYGILPLGVEPASPAHD